MKVKIEIVSARILGQDSNDRHGFDHLCLNIYLVTSLRLKVVFSYSCKLVNGQRLRTGLGSTVR